jgi:hypothetical protein
LFVALQKLGSPAVLALLGATVLGVAFSVLAGTW